MPSTGTRVAIERRTSLDGRLLGGIGAALALTAVVIAVAPEGSVRLLTAAVLVGVPGMALAFALPLDDTVARWALVAPLGAMACMAPGVVMVWLDAWHPVVAGAALVALSGLCLLRGRTVTTGKR